MPAAGDRNADLRVLLGARFWVADGDGDTGGRAGAGESVDLLFYIPERGAQLGYLVLVKTSALSLRWGLCRRRRSGGLVFLAGGLGLAVV